MPRLPGSGGLVAGVELTLWPPAGLVHPLMGGRAEGLSPQAGFPLAPDLPAPGQVSLQVALPCGGLGGDCAS